MKIAPLTEEQRDALKEISNIGMGHAATALSQLLGEKVFLRVPRVTETEIAQVPDLFGGAEQVVAGITLQILGEARGNVLLVFPRDSAHRLLARLLGKGGEKPVFDEMSASTLKEVGNILASAFLNALGSLLHMTLIPSVPLLAYDMVGAVVDFVLIQLYQCGDRAIVVETEFHGDDPRQEIIQGHFFLLPDPQTLDVILGGAKGRS
jgi:chemotaxis protein CheC